jgi:hypothetical protein
MRHAALAILLLLAGCATDAQDDANAPNLALHLAQEETAPSAFLYGGLVNVRYALSITNRTTDPVTLSRIEVRTVSSGAYFMRPTSTTINVEVPSGQEKTVPLSLWAQAPGGSLASHEPVTVRATAYMTGPKGAFVRLFTEYYAQP